MVFLGHCCRKYFQSLTHISISTVELDLHACLRWMRIRHRSRARHRSRRSRGPIATTSAKTSHESLKPERKRGASRNRRHQQRQQHNAIPSLKILICGRRLSVLHSLIGLTSLIKFKTLFHTQTNKHILPTNTFSSHLLL